MNYGHYEMNLSREERIKFNNHVKKVLLNRDMSIKELAEELGYAYKSVLKFFSDTSVKNRIMAGKIADYLAIRDEDWK